jgi:hypothetical protein
MRHGEEVMTSGRKRTARMARAVGAQVWQCGRVDEGARRMRLAEITAVSSVLDRGGREWEKERHGIYTPHICTRA